MNVLYYCYIPQEKVLLCYLALAGEGDAGLRELKLKSFDAKQSSHLLESYPCYPRLSQEIDGEVMSPGRPHSHRWTPA